MAPSEPRGPEREGALGDLRRLHADVDARAAQLAACHGERLHCGRGCSACCVDGLRVFEVEAERIRRGHPELLREAAPHAPGACAFLADDGSCRIYADRPYVCRTQGLPLRWLEGASPDGGREIVERRDICPLNLEGPPLEELDADHCWLLGPWEQRLGVIQERFAAGGRGRVALRALFRRTR